jgi:hypothetical protein
MLQGYLVQDGKIPQIVFPSTNIVTKNGCTQFWFYDKGKPKLALRGKNDSFFYVQKNGGKK